MTHKERKIFLRFLKDEEIFVAFKKNFLQGAYAKGRSRYSPDTIFGEYLQMAGFRGAISMAFPWAGTPECWSFWNRKNAKWIVFFKKQLWKNEKK